tara:strand:+ start:1193 stop:1996 length:804 start_codon:yes stop_codon:yes gene_type:complete
MAETNTFTVDTSAQTETQADNLTPDEQDSLAVGEQMAQDQEQLLAGKYKNAEELEKAYVELQKKLGDQDGSSEETETSEEEPEQPSLSDGASLISSASDEFSNDGKLSSETIEKFSSMSGKDLLDAYMEVQNAPQFQDKLSAPAAELSESEIGTIQNSVGGADKYSDMIKWAGSNLDAKQVAAFDDIIASGTADAVQFAVTALKNQYENANGYEGKMYSGKAPKAETTDVFRSQAELVQAMSDKRYDIDPAYRQDIIDKLDRSDLDF